MGCGGIGGRGTGLGKGEVERTQGGKRGAGAWAGEISTVAMSFPVELNGWVLNR